MKRARACLFILLATAINSYAAIVITFEQDGSDVRVKAIGTITSDFGTKKYYAYGIGVLGYDVGYTPISPSWWAEGVHFGYGSSIGVGHDYYYLTNDFVTPNQSIYFSGNKPSSMMGEMLSLPHPSFFRITASFTGSTIYSGGFFSGGLKIDIAKDETSVNSEVIYRNTNLNIFFAEQHFGQSYLLNKQTDPSVNLVTLNIVPEPSIPLLFASAMGGLLASGCFRRL